MLRAKQAQSIYKESKKWLSDFVKFRKVMWRVFLVLDLFGKYRFPIVSERLTPENNRLARTEVIPSAPAAKGTALIMSLLSCKQARKNKGGENKIISPTRQKIEI